MKLSALEVTEGPAYCYSQEVSERVFVRTLLEREVAVPGPWRSLADVRRANKAAGKHFFGPYKLRPLNDIPHGRFLVTPDEDLLDGKPVYSLYVAFDDGQTEQIGDAGGYRTLEEVDEAIGQLLAGARPELTPLESFAAPGPPLRPSSLSREREERKAEDADLEQEERDRVELERRAMLDPTSDLYRFSTVAPRLQAGGEAAGRAKRQTAPTKSLRDG